MTSLERDRVPSPRPIATKEVPLVDRTEEMNALKDAVYRAVHGEGGLVLLHGEAGIGKTRLIRELGAYARSLEVQVLYGRCPALFRMDGVPPYARARHLHDLYNSVYPFSYSILGLRNRCNDFWRFGFHCIVKVRENPQSE